MSLRPLCPCATASSSWQQSGGFSCTASVPAYVPALLYTFPVGQPSACPYMYINARRWHLAATLYKPASSVSLRLHRFAPSDRHALLPNVKLFPVCMALLVVIYLFWTHGHCQDLWTYLTVMFEDSRPGSRTASRGARGPAFKHRVAPLPGRISPQKRTVPDALLHNRAQLFVQGSRVEPRRLRVWAPAPGLVAAEDWASGAGAPYLGEQELGGGERAARHASEREVACLGSGVRKGEVWGAPGMAEGPACGWLACVSGWEGGWGKEAGMPRKGFARGWQKEKQHAGVSSWTSEGSGEAGESRQDTRAEGASNRGAWRLLDQGGLGSRGQAGLMMEKWCRGAGRGVPTNHAQQGAKGVGSHGERLSCCSERRQGQRRRGEGAVKGLADAVPPVGGQDVPAKHRGRQAGSCEQP